MRLRGSTRAFHRWRDRSSGHHVGRRLVAVTPQRRDGNPALELGHALIGSAQAAAAFQGTHGHRDLSGFEAGDHRRHALGIRIGTVRQQRAVQGQEFVGGLRAVAEQRFAVPGGGIHLQQHVRELYAADEVATRPALIEPSGATAGLSPRC